MILKKQVLQVNSYHTPGFSMTEAILYKLRQYSDPACNDITLKIGLTTAPFTICPWAAVHAQTK